MRLKQKMCVLGLALFCALQAMAASRLDAVQITSQGNVSIVSLRTTGSFAHNEYRPEEQKVIVDLSGVAIGAGLEQQKNVDSPSLRAYQVSSYTNNSGSQVARIELTVANGVSVKVDNSFDGLQLRLTSGQGAVAKTTVPAPLAGSVQRQAVQSTPSKASLMPVVMAKSTPAPVLAPPPASKPSSERFSGNLVRQVEVERVPNGLEIAILGVNRATSQVLVNPDRVVLDFPGAAPASRLHSISVNSQDVKGIRVGQFQAQPPITRVVVDLVGPRQFEMVPGEGRVTLKVHSSKQQELASTVTPTPAAPAPQEETASPKLLASVTTPVVADVPMSPAPSSPRESQPAETKAQEFAFVQTQPKPTPAAIAESAAQTIAKNASSNISPVLQPVAATSLVPPSKQDVDQPTAERAPARHRYTGEPISVNLKDVDLKDFFRLISEISGLNIVLDPAVSGKLTLVLNDVPWDQALEIVLHNNQLERELDGNVLRVASMETLKHEADAKAQRTLALTRAVETQTITRFLSYAHSKDVTPVVKKFLSERGDVIADDRTNALIIRDIPSSLPMLDRLVTQLDRKTQQVEIEARVVAATRSFSRDLGVQLGFAFGNSTTTVGGNPDNLSSLVNKALTPYYAISSAGAIPLFSNNSVQNASSGLSFANATKNYRIDAVLQMGESRGLLKVLSRPRIVTQNNVTAVVKQGYRLPIVTAAQLNGPSTTSYVDAFLRLTVTPQITVDNTIFLAVDVENTGPDNSWEISGNPALYTQQATTQVLVTDGGTVVIGGVIFTKNSINSTQTPLLGSIPVLGNLFKSRSVSTSTQELMFFLTPKIVTF